MELRQQENVGDFELENACVACGGTITVRVSAGLARAVCKACCTFSSMRVMPGADGVAVISRPAGLA